MQVGQAHIDFDALTIVGPTGHFTMESKVMRVLETLVEHSGEVLSRSDLIEAVWGVEYGGDERLSRAISLLRKALGDSRGKADYIETIPRRGYRLIAEVKRTVMHKTPQAEADSLTNTETPKNTPPLITSHEIRVAPENAETQTKPKRTRPHGTRF